MLARITIRKDKESSNKGPVRNTDEFFYSTDTMNYISRWIVSEGIDC